MIQQTIKLLVVEDDQAIRLMYQFKLEAEGFEVEMAADGQEGLQLAERFKPNLILLDLRMPVMGGDEMLRQLRETEWGANIRVIVLTNISKSEAPQGLAVLHVDRYIVKAHHTPNQVTEIVREVLDM